jgi:hypothetical protein
MESSEANCDAFLADVAASVPTRGHSQTRHSLRAGFSDAGTGARLIEVGTSNLV